MRTWRYLRALPDSYAFESLFFQPSPSNKSALNARTNDLTRGGEGSFQSLKRIASMAVNLLVRKKKMFGLQFPRPAIRRRSCSKCQNSRPAAEGKSLSTDRQTDSSFNSDGGVL